MSQLAALEAERDQALQARRAPVRNTTQAPSSATASAGEAGSQLLRLRSIGPEIASVLSLEAFYRNFNNRREVSLSVILCARHNQRQGAYYAEQSEESGS